MVRTALASSLCLDIGDIHGGGFKGQPKGCAGTMSIKDALAMASASRVKGFRSP